MTPALRKLVLLSIFIIAIAAVSLFIVPAVIGDPRLHSPARKKWKEQAIADIQGLSANRKAITNEIAALRAEATQSTEGWWVGTNVLVMTNGEHLVYSQICSKQNSKIHDIFLARGSDEKWYYSTYHFCIGMLTLRIEEAPGSLKEFATNFFAVEFDGKSDACLEKTWPLKK